MDLERIREAAERVARSAGTEVVDVEWKVGRQRFLRVYIDKPEGRLAGFADGKVQIEVKGRMIALPVAGICKAHLVVEL